jgi:cytochrome c2
MNPIQLKPRDATLNFLLPVFAEAMRQNRWLLMLVFSLVSIVSGATVEKADLTNDLIVQLQSSLAEPVVIARDDLYALGARSEPVYIPYIDQTLLCNVLPLGTFMESYPGFDTVIAYCYDGYVSYYSADFISQYAPYIVLDLEGNEKGNMQLEGAPDLAPFYITFAKPLKQGAVELPDPDNKRPFGVYKLKLGTHEDLVGVLYREPFENLGVQAASGRGLWMNNCMSCHVWDEAGVGGNLSNRNAKLLAMHARFNKDYFSNMIKNPQAMIPDIKMPKHPHYSDEQIENIRQFLLEIPN